MGDRTGSIPVSRTKHKRPSQKTRSFMFFAKLHIEPFKCLLANTLFACSNNIQLQTLAQTVVPDSRLSHQNKKEGIYPLFFVFVWDEEFNPSLEHLCSRIGCANSTKGRSVLARELLGEFSSRKRTLPSITPKIRLAGIVFILASLFCF